MKEIVFLIFAVIFILLFTLLRWKREGFFSQWFIVSFIFLMCGFYLFQFGPLKQWFFKLGPGGAEARLEASEDIIAIKEYRLHAKEMQGEIKDVVNDVREIQTKIIEIRELAQPNKLVLSSSQVVSSTLSLKAKLRFTPLRPYVMGVIIFRITTIKNCDKNSIKVWLYDDYPSGEVGGLAPALDVLYHSGQMEIHHVLSGQKSTLLVIETPINALYQVDGIPYIEPVTVGIR
jgi:hypothetical protein